MTIVGTRPELIRLSRVIALMDVHFDHIMVHTGQNYDYELNDILFEDLDIRKPDHYLDAVGDTVASTIGLIISKVDDLLAVEDPDAVLILGDTNSCLSVIPAKRRKIPIFHMEAGNRCFDLRVPEEINRRIVDHTSDVNIPYSDISREYLLREGLPPDRIITTGSPMREVLEFYKEKIFSSRILSTLHLKERKYYLVSAHREENIDSEIQFEKLCGVLNNLAKSYDLPVIVSTHPRTRKRMEQEDIKFHPHVQFQKPFSFSDYNHLQINSVATLSDSGTISEESSILNFPALNIRNAFERPEAMEEASVMLTGLEWNRVQEGLGLLESQKRGGERDLKMVKDYDVINVSQKIVRIILSYTDYVNRIVWNK